MFLGQKHSFRKSFTMSWWYKLKNTPLTDKQYHVICCLLCISSYYLVVPLLWIWRNFDNTFDLFWSILLAKVCMFFGLKTVYPLNCCSLPLLSPDWLTADTPHSHWLPLAHCDWPTGKRWHRAVLWLGSAGRLSHRAPPPEGVAPPPVEALRREERL